MYNALKKYLSCVAVGAALLASSAAQASGYSVYKVTITNLTYSLDLTPIMVASHRGDVNLFEAGSPASDELAAVAEGGDTGPLQAMLDQNNRVKDIQSTEGLLHAGQSATVYVRARNANRITLASMMLPTNDGFIALDSVKVPRHGTTTFYSPAYDAGSEPNDELCVSIPGPTCGGAGPSPGIDGEGFVHIHRGMHGVGNLSPDVYDWRNPVAKVTVTRMRHHY